METPIGDQLYRPPESIPWFGARKMVRELLAEVHELRAQRDEARKHLEALGALSVLQLETRRVDLERKSRSRRHDLSATGPRQPQH